MLRFRACGPLLSFFLLAGVIFGAEHSRPLLCGPVFAGDSLPDLYHARSVASKSDTARGFPIESGIKEVVPKEFRDRYGKWKSELLSTEVGRRQWESFANNREFLLKIVVDEGKKFGAGTEAYEWDRHGRLIGATIRLGKNLDRGYPDPVYYPVMNSLANYHGPYEVSGNILASAKIAHEIGHVNFTTRINSDIFRRQDKLMESYNKIFLNNGYNVGDPRLVALANELGAKPIEIWMDREYWSEANAMRYLVERINKEQFYCFVVGRIKRNVSDYAKNYQERFKQIVEHVSAPECGNPFDVE